jgi:outer membrane autotransporter protein
MLKIEGMTQFVTETYDQEEGARLYLYANPFSATDPDAIPLWVSGDAWMDGSMRADMTSATGVGFYNFIRATYYEGEPVTTFENLDPLFLAYGPAWVDGWDNDYHYRTLLGYSFSEAALGLVAAVDDWNMLRWIMGNHLQDVAESMKEMEVGEKKIHAHALGGTTSRDPADSASAGFDSTQKGISVGFDKKSNDNTVWGLYAGYTEKDIDFTGLPMVGSDWESQDTWHIGGYISKKWDRWIFSNTLTFRSTDHKTFRVQMGGDATASFDSWAITNDLRLGYVAKEIGEGSNWQVIPEVGLNVGYFDRGGYTEKNGFTYGDFDTTVVESVLGVRFRGEYERANGSKFVPQARLAWVHVLSGGDITIDQSWGGTTHWFTEYLDDDYFVADLGLSLYNMNDMDISLNYGGRFSDNSTTHGGWLRLEWRF